MTIILIPGTHMQKRVETLSEPKRADPGRRFANDEDEKHCRFQVKKRQAGGNGRDTYDDDNDDAADKTGSFIARMEAAERNRQKVGSLIARLTHLSLTHNNKQKLELTRGEKDYLANLVRDSFQARIKQRSADICVLLLHAEQEGVPQVPNSTVVF